MNGYDDGAHMAHPQVVISHDRRRRLDGLIHVMTSLLIPSFEGTIKMLSQGLEHFTSGLMATWDRTQVHMACAINLEIVLEDGYHYLHCCGTAIVPILKRGRGSFHGGCMHDNAGLT